MFSQKLSAVSKTWSAPSASAHSPMLAKNLSESQMQDVSLAEQPVAAMALVTQIAELRGTTA